MNAVTAIVCNKNAEIIITVFYKITSLLVAIFFGNRHLFFMAATEATLRSNVFFHSNLRLMVTLCQ
jgi:hypothetical protein